MKVKKGQKRSKIHPGGVKFENFEKTTKVPLENVPRVPCVKYLSPRMNRNKQQAVKVKVSKGLRSKSLKLEKFEVGKDRSWKKSTLQKFEVGNVQRLLLM